MVTEPTTDCSLGQMALQDLEGLLVQHLAKEDLEDKEVSGREEDSILEATLWAQVVLVITDSPNKVKVSIAVSTKTDSAMASTVILSSEEEVSASNHLYNLLEEELLGELKTGTLDSSIKRLEIHFTIDLLL
jgi:hypothetical protein